MKPQSFARFFHELKRRRVFRGIVVYGASTLILLEAAQNICNAFGIESVPVWFIWLLGAGFLGSLWFSWIYDITPGGIKKTDPITDEKIPIPSQKLKTYKASTFLSIIIVLGLLTYNIIDGIKTKKIDRIDKSIAVLPLFDAYLDPVEARYFEFIGHEITSCLLKVKDYRVVPWEDTRKYSRKGKTYSRMGDDLSVAILVDWKPYETKVEKHLSVDLISVEDESLLWSENYEIEGNWPGSEICKCSRRISKKITRKLKTYLTPEERSIISEEPVSARASMLASMGDAMTRDTWEMIQTGRKSVDTVKSEYLDSLSFVKAINYFTEAIKEDPTYAEAYANRAKARLWGIRSKNIDGSELGKCEDDIKKAFELQPDLPEAHVAMGFYYYYGIGEYELSLLSFQNAFELSPDNNEYLYYLSLIWRALGNWEQVQQLSNKVLESNPRNVLFLINIGFSFQYLHDFSRALECMDRAIELMPQSYIPYIYKIKLFMSTGNLNGARAVVMEAEEKTGKEFYRTISELDLYEEKYTSAIEHIEQAKASEFSDLLESDGDAYLLKAKIYKHAGNAIQAKEYFKMAIDYFIKLIMFNPEDVFAYSKLGIAYAGIGMNQLAIENGQKALELMNRKRDAIYDPYILYEVIQTYAITGDNDSAMKMIIELLNRKSPFTSAFIKLVHYHHHLLWTLRTWRNY
jgi:tetratricopeptide (TPR) repeat protein/TolB-like protein